MSEKKKVLSNLYEEYIKGTPEKAIVFEKTVFLCHLTNAVVKEINMDSSVYITTRSLKHIYDKKPAEEFEFIINNLHTIVKYPDYIYKNKNPKRGDFCFVKKLKGDDYFCSLEKVEKDRIKDGFVVTAFRLRKKNYLNNYEFMWSWRGDRPSS